MAFEPVKESDFDFQPVTEQDFGTPLAKAPTPPAKPTYKPAFREAEDKAMAWLWGAAKNVPENVGNILSSTYEMGKGMVLDPFQGFPRRRAIAQTLADPQARERIQNALIAQGKAVVADPLAAIQKHPVDAAMLLSGGLGLAGKGAELANFGRTAEALGTAAKVTDPMVAAQKAASLVPAATRRIRQVTPTARAANILREGAAEAPAGAVREARKITRETGMPLNVAEQMESPTLTKYKREFAATPGEGQASAQELTGRQATAAYDTLSRIRGAGTPEDLAEAARVAKEDLVSTAEAARGGAMSAYETLGTEAPETSGAALRDIATETRKSAKSQMDDLYKAAGNIEVGDDALAPIRSLNEVFRGTTAGEALLEAKPELGKFMQSPLARPMGSVKGVMGKVDVGLQREGLSVKDLDELRKWAGKRAWDLRTADPAQSDLLKQIVRAVNDSEDIVAKTSGAENIAALREARRFAREEYYPLFGKDAIGGRLLATKAQPDVFKILSSDFKKVFFPDSYAKVPKAIEDFKKLFGNSPEANEYLKNLVRYDAYAKTKGDPTKLGAWKAKHAEALKAYGMESEFATVDRAVEAMNAADEAIIAFDKGPLSSFLSIPEADLGKKLLDSPKHLSAAIRFAANDPSVTSGIKAAIGDALRAKVGDLDWSTPQRVADSARKAKDAWTTYGARLQQSGIYTPEELSSMKSLVEGLQRVSGRDVPKLKIKTDKRFEDMAARGAGYVAEALTGKWRAYVGGKAAAQWLGKLFSTRRNEVLNAALQNPAEARRLIRFANDLNTPGKAERAIADYNKHLKNIGLASEAATKEPEPEYTPSREEWEKQ